VMRECTGLLAQDADGVVHHAANMDQSPPAVRNVTLRVRFVDSRGTHGCTPTGEMANADTESAGTVLFEGVDWYWFTTGVSRAVRRGLASVQENWRTTSPVAHADVLRDIAAGVQPQIFVFRIALLQAAAEAATPGRNSDAGADYESLVTYLSHVRLAAPYYVVMAGTAPGQGAVIARNRTGVAAPGGVLRLGDGGGSGGGANYTSWFLVQTNYDHWVADNPADPRRTAAEATLKQLGQTEAASPLGLLAVAGTYPVANPDTAYTAVMAATQGTLHAFVRAALCPVDPGATFADPSYCSVPPA